MFICSFEKCLPSVCLEPANKKTNTVTFYDPFVCFLKADSKWRAAICFIMHLFIFSYVYWYGLLARFVRHLCFVLTYNSTDFKTNDPKQTPDIANMIQLYLYHIKNKKWPHLKLNLSSIQAHPKTQYKLVRSSWVWIELQLWQIGC